MTTPINYALVAKAHPRRHVSHKYWARKPHNVVAKYILNFTKEGDVVLDPFCGSGVTFCEAIRLKRRAIAIDLNPIACLITRTVSKPQDIKKITEGFRAIESKIKQKILDFYKTKCEKCGNQSNIIVTVYKENKPIEIRHECFNCGKRFLKTPSKKDLDLIKTINNKKITYWYPKNKLAYNNEDFKEGTHNTHLDSIDKLFTKRNLLALSILLNEINKIQNKEIKESFLFAFTSMVHLGSKMTPDRPTRPYSSFWAQHRYWIPPQNMELNIWNLFQSAIIGKQGLIETKKDINENINEYKEAKDFQDFKNKKGCLIINGSVLDLINKNNPKKNLLEENSVDYIFTDPPYGGDVQYFELSYLWNSWLKLKSNFDEEIIINDKQDKNFEVYSLMLNKAFRQMFLVLKPNKYLTVTFHNTDIKIRNALMRSVVFAGFKLEKIIYQPPARPSAKQLLQPYGSAVGDYYIRFKKPQQFKKVTTQEVDNKNYEKIVVESVKKILAERYEPTSYAWILNTIDMELTKLGYNLYSNPQDTKKILNKYKGRIFELVGVVEGHKKVKKWWFKDPSSIAFLQTTPLNERIEKAIIDVLRKNVIVTFDDILQYIFIKFPNSLTPETGKIIDVLEEYAEKTKDGKWRLKSSFKARESQHDIMIKYLIEIGRKFGFSSYFDFTRRQKDYKPTELTKTDEIINLKRVKEIDVVWLKDNKIQAIFEVENSTGITDAIIRGSNIKSQIDRFVVIPDEREGFLKRRFNEPMIHERIKQDKWKVITYNKLEKYSKLKKKTPKSFNKLCENLKDKGRNQTKIRDF